jgi:thymidylate synthase (FAD)
MANDRVKEAEELLDIQYPVLDHGFVMHDSYMGSDGAITRAARNCTAGENVPRGMSDRELIRYLMRQQHTSPFEFVEFKFLARMPIFVARPWIRHRTANVNEMSGRFGELPELVYVPEPAQIAYQSRTNKQGRGELLSSEAAEHFRQAIRFNARSAFENYHTFLGKGDASTQTLFSDEEFEEMKAGGGISRELARIDLPLNTYTQWAWKIDLHNLLHFLFLRLDEHAQWEIRQYAEIMARMVRAVCPLAWEAFEDYRLGAVTLSRMEVEVLRGLLKLYNDDAVPQTRVSMSAAEVKTMAKKFGVLGALNPEPGSPDVEEQLKAMTESWVTYARGSNVGG